MVNACLDKLVAVADLRVLMSTMAQCVYLFYLLVKYCNKYHGYGQMRPMLLIELSFVSS